MLLTSTNLYRDLRTVLRKANEIWVAVGLLNNPGLQYILDNVPNSCKLNFVVGIDLPTDPQALSKLLSLKSKRVINSRVLTGYFFHPKVYIIKSSGKLVSFVGSANCTMGGLEDNIEMSIGTGNTMVCKNLINWFIKDLFPNAQPITAEFIKDYRPKYAIRLKRRKKDEKEIDDLKEKERSKAQANIKASAKLIETLKKNRQSRGYKEIVKERQAVVKKIKRSLDYPNFRNLDLKAFFNIKALGTIVPIRVKGKITEDPTRFAYLMQLICDEKKPIKERIDEALNGRFAIDNVKEGFISKVLVAHNSKKYYLHNQVFSTKLKSFGLELPRGLSFGEKYELTREVLQMILKRTGIDDFATFDHYIRNI